MAAGREVASVAARAPIEPDPCERSLRSWVDSFVRQHLAATALLVVAVLYSALFALFFARFNGPIGYDDGYIAAFAERLIDGHGLPYVDAVSQRGPVLYWSAALAQETAGRFQWFGIRSLVAAANVLTVLACGTLGWLVRRPLVGAVAALFVTYLTTVWLSRGPGYGIHGEPVATPFLLLSLVGVAAGLRCVKFWPRHMLWMMAGSMAALAGLTKQTLLATIVPLAIWLWLVGAGPAAGPDRRARLNALAALASGWIVPLLAVVARYASHGELGTFYYWFAQFNTQVHMGAYDGRSPWREIWNVSLHHRAVSLFIACVLLGTGARILTLTWRRRRCAVDAIALETTIWLVSGVTLAGALAQLRFWPHHFLPFLPCMGLALGALVDAGLRGAQHLLPRQLPYFGTSMAIAAAATFASTAQAHLDDLQTARAQGKWTEARADSLCGAIQHHSSAHDTIVIWGFDADLYITCQRKPGTRFVFSTPVAGIVPPFWRDPRPERVAKGSQATFLDELERGRPQLILDVPRSLGGFSIRRVPGVSELLQRAYCQLPVQKEDGRVVSMWKRRERSCR